MSIEQYQATIERPADFDEFWAATVADLAAVPSRLTIEPDHLRSTDTVGVAQVHLRPWQRTPLWLAGQSDRAGATLACRCRASANSMPQQALTGEGFVVGLSVRGHNRSNASTPPAFPACWWMASSAAGHTATVASI
jgi:hypothetical protein